MQIDEVLLSVVNMKLLRGMLLMMMFSVVMITLCGMMMAMVV
jgi:hypothetical protein